MSGLTNKQSSIREKQMVFLGDFLSRFIERSNLLTDELFPHISIS